MKDMYSALVEELLQFFLSEKYTIVGAADIEQYPHPAALENDGYGDQQPKRPDVFAFDEINKRFVIGVVKITEDDLESAHSLTQYDVFFDHKNSANGKPSRVCFILPPESIAQFTGIITHYIHPDYWENLAIIRAKTENQDS